MELKVVGKNIIRVDAYSKVTGKAVYPQDIYMDDIKGTVKKINSGFAIGKEAKSNELLENLLDIKINNYVTFDFFGFINIVDTLGGVDVNAKKDYKWMDYDFNKYYTIKKGEQTLDGEHALFYSRFRKDSEGVNGRQERQMEVIKSLLSKVSRVENIVKLPKLIGVIFENIDTDFKITEVMKYSTHLIDFDDYEIETRSLKYKGETINGIWYAKIDKEDLKECIEFIGGSVEDGVDN